MLNPKQYGGFMIQDAYYFAAVEAVDNAAMKMQHCTLHVRSRGKQLVLFS